jgi:hypothetical protein
VGNEAELLHEPYRRLPINNITDPGKCALLSLALSFENATFKIAIQQHRVGKDMGADAEQRIISKLAEMQAEIQALQDGYLVINKRYTQALSSIKELTAHALESAHRSALAAEKSLDATKSALDAAKAAAVTSVIAAANAAATAAGIAAAAAAEAAAAASAAAAATASAAAFQAEEASLQASAAAAAATSRATAAAALASQLAHEAAVVARMLTK